MTSPRIFLLFFLFVVVWKVNIFAGASPDTTKPSIRAIRIESNVELTGKLTDPRWKLAQPVEIKYEFIPKEAFPARQQTSVRMLYNSDYVYFGYDVRDTHPEEIRASLTDRDKFFAEDWVNITLDTYGDYQRAYEIGMNPYAIQGDLLLTGTSEDANFDLVWESAASFNDHGWTAEIALPLKSLRFPSVPVQHWNIGFIRNYPRESDVQMSWTPIDNNNPCYICQMGRVEGLENIQSVNSMELLPYVVGQQSGALVDNTDPSSTFANGCIKARLGGGVRFAPSTDLAFEAVVNPDFSQVESDAAQISLNSNFSLFYPEKRPFFLSGAEAFQNQTQIFYSRTINDPRAAARTIGQYGPFSFAYLTASDRNTPFIIPGEEASNFVSTSLESFSNILRARYDFGDEDFLGAMVTTRNMTDAHNYVGGIDWNYKFWGNYYFRGEWFHSDTKEVNDTNIVSDMRQFGNIGYNAAFNGEQYGGESSIFMVRRNGRDYSFNLQYQDRSDVFQAEDGFIPNNGLRTATLQQSYLFYLDNSPIDQWGISLNSTLHFNRSGIRKEEWSMLGLQSNFKAQTNVSLQYLMLNDELYDGVQFDNVRRVEVQINSRPSNQLALAFDGWFGRFIKRTEPVDLGSGHTLTLTTKVKLTYQIELDLSLSRARLANVSTGKLFYDGYIARAVGIYQFNAQFFLRLIGQYDQFNKVIDIYPLLSYKLNPYSIFYAGSTYSLSDFGDPYGVRQTARQYFLKLQYLFRS
jgi:hypothetical protein